MLKKPKMWGKKVMNNMFEKYKNEIKSPRILAKLNKMSENEIKNNFLGYLSFGTAGMRGEMELGTNKINELTVCKLAESVATYLVKNYKAPSVTICFDTRHNSKNFSRIFAKVLEKNNIKVFLFKNFAPTPLCVFATRTLSTTFGVMITASHNNKKYNGIKIYDANGIQINKKVQQEISQIYEKIDEINVFNGIFMQKLTKNTIFLGKEYEKLYILSKKSRIQKNLKIVYTPLNGTGYFCVKRLLKNNRFRFASPICQKFANGNFSTCPYPNPEFEEAFIKAKKLAKRKNADIIVATDPDADRLGVMVKHNGEYVKLSGNEVGYIFADYMLKRNFDQNKFVVTSVVTSPLIDKICESYNAQIYKTLTGFMSLGTKAKQLSQVYGENAFALCYEESCGYVVRKNVFDKDGIFATLKICEIANEKKKQGDTLIDYLDEIYQKVGYIASQSDSVIFSGNDSIKQMNNFVDNLRQNKLGEFCGYNLLNTVDYLESRKTGLEKQNFLEFNFGELKFIIRPSGTEPKLKIYLFLKGENKQETDKKAKEILESVKKFIYEKSKN